MPTVTITGTGTTHSATYTLSSSTVTAVNAGTVGSTGANAGVYITGNNDTLTNSGVIRGGQVDSGPNGALIVSTGAGDTVTNQSGAVIQGYGNNVTGIYFVTAGTIINSGTISSGEGPPGGSANGILLNVGGVVTNNSTGTISGGGVYARGAATITNSGKILGDSVYGGVLLNAGGVVTNLAGGTISSGGAIYGIDIAGGAATVTNAGTITAGSASGTAVILDSGYTNRVIVDPGAVFIGTVNGGTPSQATLELASGASTGTITNLASFSNFGTLTFDPSAHWLVSGSSTGLLSTATIAGFATGDTLALAGTVSVTHSSTSGGMTEVTLSSGGTLTFAGTINGFQVSTSGGVTDLTEQATCYCSGTRILTDRGERAVEDLRIGDLVRTVTGHAEEPIVWIGYRHLDCRRHADPKQVWPVCVAANAFGPGLPHADLFLSPDHAVYVDAVLIPIKYLINGSTISRLPVDNVSYYHIELATHEVLLAEGLPAESYLDTGDRAKFGNANFVDGPEPVRLFPDFSVRVWEASGCAPLIVTGAQLTSVRRRVNARAAAMVRHVAAVA